MHLFSSRRPVGNVWSYLRHGFNFSIHYIIMHTYRSGLIDPVSTFLVRPFINFITVIHVPWQMPSGSSCLISVCFS